MTQYKRNNEELRLLVLLHGEWEPTEAQIAQLSDRDAELLENYVVKAYLRASDNLVRVPKRETIRHIVKFFKEQEV